MKPIDKLTAANEMSKEQLALIARREGASDLFVSYLLTDDPKSDRHLGRTKVIRALKNDSSLPGPWGHFVTAIWHGDVNTATQRADSANTRILRAIDTSEH